jgi:hypothetical protein
MAALNARLLIFVNGSFQRAEAEAFDGFESAREMSFLAHAF